MRIGGTDMHVVTLVFIILELIMFVYQVFFYLSHPKDKRRLYYVGLLSFLILKNIASGFFPDPKLNYPSLVVQYAIAYGMGFLMGAYFPYYFYKAFELNRLRWHALYGVPLFILLPFAVIFPLKFLFDGNIDHAINYGMVIPAGYALVLLYTIQRSIQDKYKKDIQDRRFFEVTAVYLAVVPWASLPFFAFFRIHQVPEALLTNVGFIVITILFIRRSIRESREEYDQLVKLASADGKGSLSKLDLIEQMTRQLEESGISPAQRFEINLNTVGLTSREKEIVRLVREGKPYKSIADQLFISERTVSKHIQNVFEKLGVSNKIELLSRLEIWENG
ncbi:helix-turn-helix transcriptional regulator [Dyadobacter sp. CY323]|uniref:helix-turn-helix transcriptional regulator n=1 Tax=Dyadobacter sp. CY323 TaxID=2907302 RepID=UPI002714E9E0|nr:helix-turn-helix transcriptional regulator [Dyadobacter sp. CY323]